MMTFYEDGGTPCPNPNCTAELGFCFEDSESGLQLGIGYCPACSTRIEVTECVSYRVTNYELSDILPLSPFVLGKYHDESNRE